MQCWLLFCPGTQMSRSDLKSRHSSLNEKPSVSYPRTAQYKRLHTQLLHRRGQTVPGELLALFKQSFLGTLLSDGNVNQVLCKIFVIDWRDCFLFFLKKKYLPESYGASFRVPSAPFFNRYSTSVSLFFRHSWALNVVQLLGNTSRDYPLLAAVFERMHAFCVNRWRGGPGRLQMWMFLVSLVQWFLTVQQFYLKIVKCLGPLDQGDTVIGSRTKMTW